MKTSVGVWIDHRKAVVVTLSGKSEETRIIESNVEKQPGRIDGQRSLLPYEAQMVPADDSRERKYNGQLKMFYAEVVTVIRDAGAIFIFGPGEAKNELKKHLVKDKLTDLITALETADAMTERQIAAKVRENFKKQPTATTHQGGEK